MKNSMHTTDRTPFGIQAKTPRPKMGRMAGVTPTPGGQVKPGTTANASMRARPSKK